MKKEKALDPNDQELNFRNKKNKEKDRFLKAILVSLFLHGLFLTVLINWSRLFSFLPQDKDLRNKTALKFEIMDRNAPLLSMLKEKIRAKELLKAEEEKKKNEKTSPITKMKRQIVNNENTGRDKTPIDARFLGEKNITVDRQTTARDIGSFKKAGLGDTRENNPENLVNKETKNSTGKNGKSKDGARPAKAMGNVLAKGNERNLKMAPLDSAAEKELKDLSLSDLGLKNFKAPAFAAGSDGTKKSNGSKGATDDAGKSAFFKGKSGILNGDKNTTGESRNNDFIEDVPLGDMTNLNTIQFKYFGFYARIRSKLEQYWGTSLREKAEKLMKGGRTIASNENYITSLRITIDNKGNIVKVMVVGTSGFKDLDDAAVESFNTAGPFPNPPKGMMENGMATIEWGFVVKS